ncbi:unnamed protein product [Linum tenue]|uniref:TIR domain-containing protein n=1 Tax=Linum tenue TaxID=586396 RepID=A0AAV0I8T1_9ROSI|nr:unnamed protein product [Linum tenue]
MDVREALTAAVTALLMLPALIFLCKWLFRRWRRSSNTWNDSPQLPESVSSSAYTSGPDASLFSPTSNCEVFLSFRGPDTRHEITDVLYHFLLRSKIRTFKHDEDLHEGEGIWPSLVEVMKESKVYVPILSENYAHSKWCLKELAEMVDCRRQDKGHIILPIFYKVDPRDVRKQSGAYEEAFKRHARNFDGKTLQIWKDALKEVGELKGWHVTDKEGQGAIADEVFDNIWSHLSENYELMTDELVGIDGHLKAVVERLDLNSKAVTTVGIHGIGGIGKTTVATAVYNRVCARFDRHCFVEDVRETLERRDGIIALQNKIISGIVRKATHVSSDSEGIRMIKDRVSHHKVLIVLDDVDDKFKFDGILGKFETFFPGSRFIFTSRNIKVLTLVEGCWLYEVGEMSYEHSFELFCKHAFRMDSAPHDYATLSRDIVSTAGGLPLTIKVVGSLLFEEGKAFWEETLLRLRETSETEVLERLKISYDTLEYEAKEIFLDIACFYVGTDREIASYMWSDCRFYPISSINVLIQRSMIKVGDNNEFKMHDQLRDLGKEIVHEEDTEHPWMRSRIWLGDDTFQVLHNNKGMEKVKALQLTWLPLDTLELTNEQFSNSSELRYFCGDYIKITGDFSGLLQNLRWIRLRYHENSGDRISNFHMSKLVILDLRSSFIRDDWGGWSHIKMAKNLKVLNLSYCRFVTKFPEISTYGSLEHLDLSGITGTTQELNIDNMRNMKVLILENCTLRKIVSNTIGILQGLRELDVSRCNCENLGPFLADIRRLKFLKILRATEIKPKNAVLELPTSLKELSTSFSVANLSNLNNLEQLTVEYCDHVSIPLQFPSSLVKLHVIRCPMLEKFPSLDNLGNLTEMSIIECPKLKVIEGLGEDLRLLRNLSIRSADSLTHLDGLDNLLSLTDLHVEFCDALERVCIGVPALNIIERLDINHCPFLTEIFKEACYGANQVFESLQELVVGGINLVQGLPHLSKFPSLRKLDVYYMGKIVKLEGLEFLEELQTLCLSNMKSMERLPSLLKLGKLRVLYLQSIPLLREIEGLEELKSLEELTIDGCKSLERLPDVSGFHNLRMVNILYCHSLEWILDLSDLKNLERLSIRNCAKLADRFWFKRLSE